VSRRPLAASTDGPRWLPSAICLIVLALTLALVAWYLARVVATDPYRSIIPGIWLALGRDLADGLLYRPLMGEAGYGGTRYFPLQATVIATWLRLGLAPAWAWLLTSVLSAAVLASGVWAATRALRIPTWQALTFVAAATAPYFILQTLVELRCDVLAAGLNVWGIALLLPAWTEPEPRLPTGVAAVAFTLAFATKVTSPAVPAASIAALALSGRRTAAIRVGWLTAIGMVLVVVATNLVSDGRAVENWRVSLFAGSGAEGTMAALLSGAFLDRLLDSRFLTVLGAATVGALIAAWRLAPRTADPPARAVHAGVLLFLGAGAAMAVTLSSPGAVANNQAVEWVAIAVVVLALTTRVAAPVARPVSIAIVTLAVWAGAQDVSHVWAYDAGSRESWTSLRGHVIDRIARTRGPVLTESAEWSVLADRPAVILDPFMFRIVADARPDMRSDLVSRIERHEFDLIVLQEHPGTPRGRLWFETVDLGWPVANAILARYELDERVAADVWFFVPRDD